jgi:hypothetical protein
MPALQAGIDHRQQSLPTVIDLGKPMAYDQDMTDCGAVIYSRHNNHAGWGEKGSDDEAAATPIEDYVPKQAPRFQEHFVLHNNETGEPLAGVPYTIKTGDGKTFEGETDHRDAPTWCGRTHRCLSKWPIRSQPTMPTRTTTPNSTTRACNDGRRTHTRPHCRPISHAHVIGRARGRP